MFRLSYSECCPSPLMTYYRIATKVARRVPTLEQERITLPEHLSSQPIVLFRFALLNHKFSI